MEKRVSFERTSPKFDWVDTAFGGVHNRNKIQKAEYVSKLDLSKMTDCYSTYFRFGDDFKIHVEKTGSVKGFSGVYTAYYLPIDIDCEEDLTVALQRTRDLILRLQLVYGLCNADIEVFFSGAKGFHVQLPQEVFGGFAHSDALAGSFKRVALEITSGIEIDPSIYDTVRLWRIPNTKNGKTGLYKIPLSIPDIFNLSVDEIRAKAGSTAERVLPDPTLRDDLRVLFSSAVFQKKAVSATTTQKLYPQDEKLCIYQMLNDGVVNGERNNALLRLAGYFHRKLPTEVVEGQMRWWNDKHSLGLGESEIKTTVESAKTAYDFGCNDGLLSKYCMEQCTYFRRKKDLFTQVKTIVDLENEYLEYIKTIDQQKIRLDLWLPRFGIANRGITAGEVVVVVAGSGVGKTAFLQNLLWHVKYPTIFFSYELPEILTYERFYQIVNSCSDRSVEESYREGTHDSTSLKQGFSKLLTVFNSDVEVETIPELVLKLDASRNEKTRIVAIDYLGLVKGGKGSRYERVSYIAETLKAIAKKTQTVVICLAQVSRGSGAQGNEELTLTSGKDSGSIENTGDLVIGLWRPYKNHDKLEDNVIRVEVLKNRKGKDGIHIDCEFDKETLRITEIPVPGISTEEKKAAFVFGAERTP